MLNQFLSDFYAAKPFKKRNADEYELSQVLDLFVPPSEGLDSPFEYQNEIVRGRMGSGKTMYLKANYAFHLYQMVPSILNGKPLTVPVLIPLNDFQHLEKPEDIYREVIIRIIEEMCTSFIKISDANKMGRIHNGMKALPSEYIDSQSEYSSVIAKIRELKADEYQETIAKEFGQEGGLKFKFLSMFANYKNTQVVQLKQNRHPGISDIRAAYDTLLAPTNGRILLLLDEAGSLTRSFYAKNSGSRENSFFEILMNQLRTSEYIKTKVAVYPHSFQDILAESRYGDIINLKDNIATPVGYKAFCKKAVSLMERYARTATNNKVGYEDFFEGSMAEYTGALEQLVNATDGNIRKLVLILDKAMSVSYENNEGKGRITQDNILAALKNNAQSMVDLFNSQEREFLDNIGKVCKNRKTYKFKFPYKSPTLSKYTNKSEEDNILKVVQLGAGRQGTIYSFDYAYCVLMDIPTHYIGDSEAIDKDRSLTTGTWITRVADISQKLIDQANLPGKIEGQIKFLSKDGASGFIKDDKDGEYFFAKSMLIPGTKDQDIRIGRQCRFYPISEDDTLMAYMLELL